MAEKILQTRILNKVDTLEAWNSSTLKLKKGELAFATVAASAGTGLTEPVVMVKIGTEEEKTFAELPWAFHAKASDVLAACKTEAGLRAFVNGVIADAGIASDDAMQELAGRVTTAEGEIDTLQSEMDAVEAKAAANESAIGVLNGLVGDTKVADQITTAINNLNLANTYEAKGEAAKVQTALDTYKTSNDAAVKANADAIAAEAATARAAEKANADAIALIKDGTTIDSFADVESALAGKEASGSAAQALADAKTYADGLAGNYDAKGSAAAAESAAKAYADGLAGNYDAAGSAAAAQAAAEATAKGYTDSELTRLVGDKTVGTQITEAITGLDLANTYDAKGAAAAAESAAKSHADGLNSAMDERVQALEAIDHDHDNKDVLDGITAEKVAAWDAAEANAKSYADELDGAMDERVQALEAKFGDGEGNVEAQIAAAVAAEKERAEAAEKANADAIDAIEADYLKAADKEELAGDISDNADAIAALQELVGDEKVSDAIAAEAEAREAADTALGNRVKAIEDDYLKAADKTELQGNIDTVSAAVERLTNGVSADEIDGVNDLIAYVNEHGTEVTGIKADIKANADAIDAIEADYLKAADKTELEGKITAAQNAADAAQGEVDALEEVVATKAAQADLESAVTRIGTAEGKITTLEGEMDSAEGRLDALETKVGDETVAAQIEAAIEALKIGDYAKAADLTAAIERIAQNETDIDALEGRMDTAEGDIEALEASIATKANDADLAAIAKTGNVNDLVQTTGDVLVFDCGSSAV